MTRSRNINELRAIDLCCGAGGWACAARGLPIRIVAAVDFWDVACRTYGLNHPGTVMIQADLRDPRVQDALASEFAGKCDVIVGGIPCEWLSSFRRIGNGPSPAEIDRERETLRSVLSLVYRIGPRYWCLEDVAGLVRELPEATPWIQLDAGDYSAQRRKRIYVGRFPRPQGVGPLIRKRCSLLIRDRLRPGPFRIGSRASGRELVTRQSFHPDKALAVHLDRKSPTICQFGSRRDSEFVIVDPRLAGGRRQIEWQECACLQGFPEDYVFYGCPGDVSVQIARAVQIDTARVILQGIVLEAFGDEPIQGRCSRGDVADR